MPWKSITAGTALLFAAAVGLGFFWPFGQKTETLRLPGVVEIQEVRLGSKIGGRVAEVLTAEGDLVVAGQPLVRFEVPELEAQREQCAAHLRSLQAEYERAKNGPRPEEIRQGKSDLEASDADLKLAREDFARIGRLYRNGGSDRAEYDSSVAARDRAQGRMKSAQARLDMLLAGSRAEDIADAEARVAETRGKIRELDANLAEAVVKAPERSIVEVLGVRKGDLVAPNQPIIRVLRVDDLWVKVYVPEPQLGKVRLKQPVRVTIDSFPNKEFKGEVLKIDAESEFTPRNVQSADQRRFQVFGIRIRIADPGGVFKSGLAAEVTFELNPPP